MYIGSLSSHLQARVESYMKSPGAQNVSGASYCADGIFLKKRKDFSLNKGVNNICSTQFGTSGLPELVGQVIWSHFVFFVVFFTFLKQVPIYISSLREC